MYSDLLSKVHLGENGIWKVSPNIYLENNISILLFSTKCTLENIEKNISVLLFFIKMYLLRTILLTSQHPDYQGLQMSSSF